MHLLQPNTPYRIVTVQIAVPAKFSASETEDSISYWLAAETLDNELVDDWRFVDRPETAPLVRTGRRPREGEVFHRMTVPAWSEVKEVLTDLESHAGRGALPTAATLQLWINWLKKS